MSLELVLYMLRNIPLVVILIPLLFCSILLLAVFIERFFFFKSLDIDYTRVIDDSEILKNKESNPILDIAKNSEEYKKQSYFKYQNVLINCSEQAIRKVERFASVVSTIATISPMIGLLGTVTGMMKSFNALADKAASSSPQLASGIAEALLTTAIGLIVAIPAIIFYNYISVKSNYYIKEIEYVANYLSEVHNEKNKV